MWVCVCVCGGGGGQLGERCGTGVGGNYWGSCPKRCSKQNKKNAIELQPSISDSYRSARKQSFFKSCFKLYFFSMPQSKGFKQNFSIIYLRGMSQSLNKKYKTQKSDFCYTLCNFFPAQKLGFFLFVFVLITRCFLEADNSSPLSIHHEYFDFSLNRVLFILSRY